ncbi:MAG: hypothetical protein ACLFQ8_02995 [Candidatus Aenigmatarchaeota archaeon]
MKVDVTKQQIAVILVIILFGGSAIVYAISAALPEAGNQAGPAGEALLEIRTCGEQREIPDSEGEIDGASVTVTSDGIISFPTEAGVTLGQVFDLMNVTFTSTELMEYENNNMCNTTYSNEVSVSKGKTIEGMEKPVQSIDQYRSYTLEHGDYIIVRYD